MPSGCAARRLWMAQRYKWEGEYRLLKVSFRSILQSGAGDDEALIGKLVHIHTIAEPTRDSKTNREIS
jgi:hypothetical protein